jgi:hypothetical protein
MVHANRLDEAGFAEAPADPTGAFTMSLAGGEWIFGVEPLVWPVSWVFAGPPAWIAFELPINVPETKTVVLPVIPTDATITGRVVCPGGVTCPMDPPHWAIGVELRNDDLQTGTELDIFYQFEINVPAGWYELVVHVDHPMLQGPKPIHRFVGPGERLDVGNIELVPKDARIVGQVRTGSGLPVPHVPVIAWPAEGFGWGWAKTDASGTYTMHVTGGEWFVEPIPELDAPFVFRQRPQLVRVLPMGTVTGIDFTLTRADARIDGIAVDSRSYERLWGLDGWAEARVVPVDEFFSDAPMWDGGFNLKARGGFTYAVGVHLPPHAPYVSGGTGPVPVGPGANVPISVPLEHKDAVIAGRMINALTGSPVNAPIWGFVFGDDERGHWGGVGVDPELNDYELAVVSGTWHLNAWTDPESGFVAVPTETVVTVQSGQLIPQDFEVWPINAPIRGQVQKPDGSPLPKAFVFAEGESPHVGYFEAHVRSDAAGNFELFVPEGVYIVGAAVPPAKLESENWLYPPPLEDVVTSVFTPAVGLNLQFRQLDGEINGTISFAAGLLVTPTHPAYVWGWSEDGEWAETEAHIISGTSTFTYSMKVVSDTIWHIGTVYEDWDNGAYYESPEAVVPVTPPTGLATQNLVLGGPWSLPSPIVVSFDASQMQTIVFPNGVQLSIPPGALAISGTVTLYIFPTREMRPEAGREIIGTGYEIWATDQNGQEITQFNQNVVVRFPYPSDAALQARGINENLLVPVYYSTLIGRWILAESYVVDTENNEITLQLNHFSKFGLFSTAGTQEIIYLPIVISNSS